MLKKHSCQYSIIYEVDFEDGGYIASVPSLPGCHTQGDSLEEAEKNIKEAIEVYLASLKKSRSSVPEEEKIYHGTVEVLLPA